MRAPFLLGIIRNPGYITFALLASPQNHAVDPCAEGGKRGYGERVPTDQTQAEADHHRSGHQPAFAGEQRTPGLVISASQPNPQVKQPYSAEKAGDGRKEVRLAFTDEIEGDGHQADPEQDGIVQVNQGVAGLPRPVFIDQLVELDHIGDEEQGDHGEDEHGQEGEFRRQEISDDPDDGLSEGDDGQQGQPLQQMAEYDRTLTGVFAGQGGRYPAQEDAGQGDDQTCCVIEDSADHEGQAAEKQDSGEGQGDPLVMPFLGVEIGYAVLDEEGQGQQAGDQKEKPVIGHIGEAVRQVKQQAGVDEVEKGVNPRCLAVSIGENGLDHPGIDEDDDDDGEGNQDQRADDALMQVMDQPRRPRNHIDENKVVKKARTT